MGILFPMRTPATWLSALCLTLILAAPARAEPPEHARQLYAGGDYIAAADSAEAAATPQSLAFAARALMAACVSSPGAEDLDAWLARAEAAAHAALALDPEAAEPRLQWALALGMRGRRASLAEAVARNYAPRGRRLILEALAREPDNAWGHALLGAWNLEVLRRGGRAGAALYGARLDTGLAEFARARALAPGDPMIAIHAAISMLEYDPNAYAARASALLEEASHATPGDAFESHSLGAARRVAEALRDQGPMAARAIARAAFL